MQANTTSSGSTSASKKDPMLDYVVEEFNRYEQFHSDRFEQCKKYYDHWIGKPPTRGQDWQNAVHVPMTIEAEQTITPRIFAALFPDEAPISVMVEGEGTEEEGIIIRDAVKHFFRVADVQGEALLALTQNTLFGTGYLESPWKMESKWITVGAKRTKVLISSRPDGKHVDFFEMFPHPNKLRMDDGLPLIRRQYCDAEYLKSLGTQFDISNISKALNSKLVSGPRVELKEQTVGDDKTREKYEILQYWGPWDASYEKDNKVVTDLAVPYWIIVVNREVVIRAIPNPFDHQRPPYCKFTLYPDAKPSWFGVGIGQIGRPCQERINKIVNQRLDNVDLVLNKQGCYNGNDTLINTKKLQVSKPGLWHKVSDTVTSLRWMDTPDVTTSSYKEEELAKIDFRESTGATVPLMPNDGSEQHRTAMGISLLQGAAGARFKPVLRKLETDLVQDMAMMFLSNMKQFMVMPEWIMVMSDSGKQQPVQVTPEQIQAKAKFIPTGVSETLNKEAQIGQLLRFKELTMQDPTVNRAEINKRIAEQMGFKNIPALLTPPPTMTTPQVDGLPPEVQMKIQQRLAEGASPDQIKLEMLGQPPNPQDVQAEQQEMMMQQQGGQGAG